MCATLPPPPPRLLPKQVREKVRGGGGGGVAGDEADLSPQSAVRIKIHEALPALPCTSSWRGVENRNSCESFRV
jgi:hypothetical protein